MRALHDGYQQLNAWRMDACRPEDLTNAVAAITPALAAPGAGDAEKLKQAAMRGLMQAEAATPAMLPCSDPAAVPGGVQQQTFDALADALAAVHHDASLTGATRGHAAAARAILLPHGHPRVLQLLRQSEALLTSADAKARRASFAVGIACAQGKYFWRDVPAKIPIDELLAKVQPLAERMRMPLQQGLSKEDPWPAENLLDEGVFELSRRVKGATSYECNQCGKIASAEIKLRECKVCEAASYCGRCAGPVAPHVTLPSRGCCCTGTSKH